jgi:hypothetical protein
MAPPAAAAPARDNPYWNSRTNLPAQTITGEWTLSEGRRHADLSISGRNLPAQSTSFKAGWITPWGGRRGFSEEGQLDLVVTPLTTVTFKDLIRYQIAGQKWSPWLEEPFMRSDNSTPLRAEGTWMTGFGVGTPATGRPPKIRYERRILGKIEGTASLSITISMSLD